MAGSLSQPFSFLFVKRHYSARPPHLFSLLGDSYGELALTASSS